MTRYSDETDVLIIGGGPAGLSAACRIKQMAADDNREVKVTVVEKAAELGETLLTFYTYLYVYLTPNTNT